VDTNGNNVRVITSYRPDPSDWTNNFKERRIK
jgi:hypothetical protein